MEILGAIDWGQIVDFLSKLDWLELFAATLGVISVAYARKENILVFPIGLVNVSIYIYIYFVARFYANAGINIVYFISNAYGWYLWGRTNEDDSKLKVSNNTKLQNWLSWSGAVVVYVVVYYLLIHVNRDNPDYLNTYLPYLDSFNTSFFLIATILMAFKKVENWVFWTVGNVVSIPIFLWQGLYFTSLQYALFLLLAVLGWKEWGEKSKKELIEK